MATYTRSDYIREQRAQDQRNRVIEREQNRQLRRIEAQDRRATSEPVRRRQQEEERRILGSANPNMLAGRNRVAQIQARANSRVDAPQPTDAPALTQSNNNAREAVASMFDTIRETERNAFRPEAPQDLFAPPQAQPEQESFFADTASQLGTSLDRSVQRLAQVLGTQITPRLDGTAVNPVASPSMGFTGPTTMGITSGQPALLAFQPSIGLQRRPGAFTWGGR